MKAPWDWDESDLLNLISVGAQESMELEFKRSEALADARKDEIRKDVSAMANAAGGTIVYGMKEDGHKATALDDGSDPKVITKEWLEHVITSKIQPRLQGVRITPV